MKAATTESMNSHLPRLCNFIVSFRHGILWTHLTKPLLLHPLTLDLGTALAPTRWTASTRPSSAPTRSRGLTPDTPPALSENASKPVNPSDHPHHWPFPSLELICEQHFFNYFFLSFSIIHSTKFPQISLLISVLKTKEGFWVGLNITS